MNEDDEDAWADGRWQMEDGRWQMADGLNGRCTELADGRWQMWAGTGRQVAGDSHLAMPGIRLYNSNNKD
jgi:2-amino-4-hydroxy-6-hydroxymethyldihydropteridine diphosphokinase